MPGHADTIAACQRALAASTDIQTIGVLPAMSKAGHRGAADAQAFWQRFHDLQVHRRLLPAEPVARRWFDEFERVRVESLGGRWFAGAAHNMRIHRSAQDERATAKQPVTRIDRQVATQTASTRTGHEVSVLGTLREALGHAPAQDAARPEPPVLSVTATALDLRREELQCLANCLTNQHAFGQHALSAIRRLLSSLESGEEDAAIAGVGATGDEPESGGERSGPTSDDAAGEGSSDSTNETPGEAEEPADDAVSEPVMHDDPAGEARATVETTGMADGERDAADEAAWVVNDQGSIETTAAAAYRVFTTRHDRTIAATSLAQATELAALRQRLDGYIDRQGQLVQRLANRLYRRLLARQRRAWQFDEPPNYSAATSSG